MRSVRFFVVLSILLSAVTTRAADDSIVVMISLDGFGSYYMDDPKAEIPTLRQLADAGARADSMLASTPTVTWTNHATLMTGVQPARHGVVGNTCYDRATHKRLVLIADPVLDKEQLVRVPTIYDLAHAAGMVTAAVRWPASRNAKGLDYNLPDVGTVDLWEKSSTPGLIDELHGAGIHPETVDDGVVAPGDSNPPNSLLSSAKRDQEWTRAFNLILRKHHPRLALLHLANIDHQEHAFGPRSPQAYDAIHTADAQVKEVWEEMCHDYPAGQSTLVVVSDHGFSAIDHMLLPNVILREAGLIQVKGIRPVAGPVTLVPQGGAALVYVTDPTADRNDVMRRVKEAFVHVKGISKVLMPEDFPAYGVATPSQDSRGPDMVLFAELGYVLGDTAGGALSVVEKPERKGSHGHDPHLPELHATFFATGRGVKAHARLGEVANIDVAPTVAHLLGLEMKAVDGRVLREALDP